MMSIRKCNSAFVGIMLLIALLRCNAALAETYTVGDATGWKFNVSGWENGKSFKAGDTLGTYIDIQNNVFVYLSNGRVSFMM